jgi:hypothetical protein
MGTVFFFFIRFLLFELWGGVAVFASGGAAPFVSPHIFRAIVFTPFAYLMMVKILLSMMNSQKVVIPAPDKYFRGQAPAGIQRGWN